MSSEYSAASVASQKVLCQRTGTITHWHNNALAIHYYKAEEVAADLHESTVTVQGIARWCRFASSAFSPFPPYISADVISWTRS